MNRRYKSQAFGYDLRACIMQAVDGLLTDMGRDGVLVIDGSITVCFTDGQAVAYFTEDE